MALLADWDLWTRLALRTPAAALSLPLHAYHLHGGSMSARDRNGEAELRTVEEKYARDRQARGVTLNTEAFSFWLAIAASGATAAWPPPTATCAAPGTPAR